MPRKTTGGEYFYEEESPNGKLYSREVLRLLFSYLWPYRRSLAAAFFLVLCIAGANLAVPYLFKTIVDRHLIKRGRTVSLSRAGQVEEGGVPGGRADREDGMLDRRLDRGVRLDGDTVFLYQSELKYFSRGEIKRLAEQGILSESSYVLIESQDPGPLLRRKIQEQVAAGTAEQAGPGTYLFEPETLQRFTVSELARLRRGDYREVVRSVLLILGILLVQLGSSYLQIVLLMRLSQRAMRDLRRDLFAHTLSLEVSFYDRNPVGRLVNRVTNDVEKLNELFSSVLVTLFQDLLLMAGITAVMFLTSPRMALLFSASFPLLALLTVLFRLNVRNAYRLIRTRISELNSFLNETISGIRIVQIFAREAANLAGFRRVNRSVYDAHLRQLYVVAVFHPLIAFMRWFTIAVIIYFGARGIVQDWASFGLLVMFIAYAERFFHPIQDLSQKFDIMQSANAAGEKILSLLRAPATKEDGRGGAPESRVESAARFQGRIRFEDVWFAYNPGEWVLKGVSFEVSPRQTLAIVGETGAGKTTVINILSRFYPLQRGRVLIDGRELDSIPYEEVRRNIAVVMQDIFLFSRSVRENIVLGDGVDPQRFERAVAASHADRFIRGLPLGREEQVMERGVTFSAGERQLLSFARALYTDPAVLVLDEATSSIDTETEMLIQDAIARLTRGRTSIVIAHRLSTIRNADRILVLERGRIAEQGTHAELMAKGGLYHRFYSLQFETLQ